MAEKQRKQLINLHSGTIDAKPVGKLSLGEIAVVHVSGSTKDDDTKLYVETVNDSNNANTLATFITEGSVNKKVQNVYNTVAHLAEVVLDSTINSVSGDTVISANLVNTDASGNSITISHKSDFTPVSGFNKISSDKFGHVTGSTPVTTADVEGLIQNYKGTVTGVKENGSTKSPDTNGIVDLGTVVNAVNLNGSAQTITDGVLDLTVTTDHAEHALIANDGTPTSQTTAQTVTIVDSLSGSPKTSGNLNLYSTRKTINNFTDEERTKLSGIENGAQVNVIEKVKVNGTEQTITDKSVDITVPTQLSELSDDATHRLVTDTEKSTWNGKQDAINDLTTIRNNASSGATAYTDMLTGVTMNGSAVSKANKVADLGTVVTAVDLNGSAQTITNGKLDLVVTTDHAKHKLIADNGTATAETAKTITYVESLAGTNTATDGDLTVSSTRKTITIPSTLDDITDGSTRKLSDYTPLSAFTAHTGDTTAHITAQERTNWNNKQDAIDDLTTIRNNASSGATAYTNMVTGATINGSNVTVTNKVLNLGSNYVQDANYVHTDNNYTTTEKNKLAGIEEGAEVNVQADWNETATTSDAFIQNKPDLNVYPDSAEWNSTDKKIYFKNNGTTLTSMTIDGANFVKDGMVDNVLISGGSLVITFNTDAGKQDIAIPLTDIFNPNNYYTKTEIDNKHFVSAITFNNKTVTGDTAALGTLVTGITMNGDDLTVSNTGVVDLGTVLTAETQLTSASTGNGNAVTDIAVSGHQITFNLGATYTTSGDVETQIESALTEYYTKEEIDDSEEVVSAALNDLNARIIELSGNSGQVDLSAYWTSAETQDYVESALTQYYTKEEIDNAEKVIAASLNDLNDRKADKTDIPVVSGYATEVWVEDYVESALTNYYTKEEIDDDSEVIAAALNDLNERIIELSGSSSDIDLIQTVAEFSAVTMDESNPSKKAVDATVLKKVIVEDERVTAAALNDLDERLETLEQNISGDVYTKEEVDELIADIDVSDQLDGLRQELTGAINNERSQRQSADNAINSKLNQLSANTEYYVTYDFLNPKEEVIAAAINDLNDRIGEIEESVTGSVYTKEEADDKFLTKEQWIDDEFVISTALNDLNNKIAVISGNSGQVDLSGYYTSGQTDAAIATATANLVTSGDVASYATENFYTKDEIDLDGKVISAAMNNLNTRVLALENSTDTVIFDAGDY